MVKLPLVELSKTEGAADSSSEPEDEAAVVAGLNDLAVSGWLAVVPFPYGPADFQLFCNGLAKPGATFTIEDETGFVGIIG